MNFSTSEAERAANAAGDEGDKRAASLSAVKSPPRIVPHPTPGTVDLLISSSSSSQIITKSNNELGDKNAHGGDISAVEFERSAMDNRSRGRNYPPPCCPPSLPCPSSCPPAPRCGPLIEPCDLVPPWKRPSSCLSVARWRPPCRCPPEQPCSCCRDSCTSLLAKLSLCNSCSRPPATCCCGCDSDVPGCPPPRTRCRPPPDYGCCPDIDCCPPSDCPRPCPPPPRCRPSCPSDCPPPPRDCCPSLTDCCDPPPRSCPPSCCPPRCPPMRRPNPPPSYCPPCCPEPCPPQRSRCGPPPCPPPTWSCNDGRYLKTEFETDGGKMALYRCAPTVTGQRKSGVEVIERRPSHTTKKTSADRKSVGEQGCKIRRRTAPKKCSSDEEDEEDDCEDGDQDQESETDVEDDRDTVSADGGVDESTSPDELRQIAATLVDNLICKMMMAEAGRPNDPACDVCVDEFVKDLMAKTQLTQSSISVQHPPHHKQQQQQQIGRDEVLQTSLDVLDEKKALLHKQVDEVHDHMAEKIAHELNHENGSTAAKGRGDDKTGKNGKTAGKAPDSGRRASRSSKAETSPVREVPATQPRKSVDKESAKRNSVKNKSSNAAVSRRHGYKNQAKASYAEGDSDESVAGDNDKEYDEDEDGESYDEDARGGGGRRDAIRKSMEKSKENVARHRPNSNSNNNGQRQQRTNRNQNASTSSTERQRQRQKEPQRQESAADCSGGDTSTSNHVATACVRNVLGRLLDDLVRAAEKSQRQPVSEADMRRFAEQVMQGLYADVRRKLSEKMDVEYKEAGGTTPFPKEDLLEKADREVHDQVLPVIVEHIVWLMREEREALGQVDCDMMMVAFAGQYIDTIVTNAVLKTQVDLCRQRAYTNTCCVSSNDVGGSRAWRSSNDNNNNNNNGSCCSSFSCSHGDDQLETSGSTADSTWTGRRLCPPKDGRRRSDADGRDRRPSAATKRGGQKIV